MNELEYRPLDELLLMQGRPDEITQVYRNFAYILKMKRLEIHLSQEKAARFIGVSTTFLGNVERVVQRPSFSRIITAMHLFNISFDDFLFYNSKTYSDSGIHPLDLVITNLDDQTKDAILESYMSIITQIKHR